MSLVTQMTKHFYNTGPRIVPHIEDGEYTEAIRKLQYRVDKYERYSAYSPYIRAAVVHCRVAILLLDDFDERQPEQAIRHCNRVSRIGDTSIPPNERNNQANAEFDAEAVGILEQMEQEMTNALS